MRADDQRHGTYGGAVAHWSDGETCCDPCRVAATRYRKGLEWEHQHGRRRTMPTCGAVRRMQALQRLGWSIPAIAAATGVDHRVLYAVGTRHSSMHRATFDAITSAYDQLSMRFPPETTRGERISAARARNRAERAVWPPPLAWDDDIDDPKARPHGRVRAAAGVDETVVERVLLGEWRLPTSRADKVAVVARYLAAGAGSLADLERLTGWNVHRYVGQATSAEESAA